MSEFSCQPGLITLSCIDASLTTLHLKGEGSVWGGAGNKGSNARSVASNVAPREGQRFVKPSLASLTLGLGDCGERDSETKDVEWTENFNKILCHRRPVCRCEPRVKVTYAVSGDTCPVSGVVAVKSPGCVVEAYRDEREEQEKEEEEKKAGRWRLRATMGVEWPQQHQGVKSWSAEPDLLKGPREGVICLVSLPSCLIFMADSNAGEPFTCLNVSSWGVESRARVEWGKRGNPGAASTSFENYY
ncbi:hypothetical protein O3P69_006754 [Scylla paramamosain]|uniref:Uncharacterized protein n=1 Tax=Scylla paramamosain TaxID=85552 RepID=A0AAW0U2E1_SCYPA